MIKKVERKSVSDAVLEEVKRLIINGEWKEGTKIPSENELANMMGVSRVSVRSALQKLSSLGLVESRQGGGTFVCQLDGTQNLHTLVPLAVLSNDNQKYMVEFRRILESEAAYLAAERATEEEITKMRDNLRKYQESEQKNPMSEEGLTLDVEFHMMVSEATHNPMLIQVISILRDTITENIRYAWKNAQKSEALVSHGRIIRAIEERNPVEARKGMWEHMNVVWDLIKNK
ncbi:MAG: FadR family transcriptional regulator [Lachnospiraceae bacterium]|nr:FadR family transcriptional regulator [Lachnospiraceae bacterium]